MCVLCQIGEGISAAVNALQGIAVQGGPAVVSGATSIALALGATVLPMSEASTDISAFTPSTASRPVSRVGAPGNVQVDVNVSSKLDVALAVGPTEVDYSTFADDLRALLTNNPAITNNTTLKTLLAGGSRYVPPVQNGDLFIDANAKPLADEQTKEFRVVDIRPYP